VFPERSLDHKGQEGVAMSMFGKYHSVGIQMFGQHVRSEAPFFQNLASGIQRRSLSVRGNAGNHARTPVSITIFGGILLRVVAEL
jgi:hypothetical protein